MLTMECPGRTFLQFWDFKWGENVPLRLLYTVSQVYFSSNLDIWGRKSPPQAWCFYKSSVPSSSVVASQFLKSFSWKKDRRSWNGSGSPGMVYTVLIFFSRSFISNWSAWPDKGFGWAGLGILWRAKHICMHFGSISSFIPHYFILIFDKYILSIDYVLSPGGFA